MSEERTPNAIWRFNLASVNGKKTLKIELFSAAQWRRSRNPFKRNMYPHPPMRTGVEEYWQDYYRLRINGRWYSKKKCKFHFFTMVETVELAEQIKKKGYQVAP